MYFSSEAGKGFIISDDEEVTGVISVRNTEKKKKTKKSHPSFGNMITDSITDTMKRKGKKKRSKQSSTPSFLFVSKPYFSSEESIEKSCYVPLQAAFGSKYMLDGNTDIDGKKFNSGLNQRVSRTRHNPNKKASGNQYK